SRRPESGPCRARLTRRRRLRRPGARAQNTTAICWLVLLQLPIPGIGARWTNAEQLNEIWYQSFNQQPWAAELIGSSRESCRLYIGHFLAHWAGGNPHAFDDVLDDFVDKFLEP